MLFADVVIALVILCIVAIVITAVASIFLRTPFVPTPYAVIRTMIGMADLKDSHIIYDLGAGDARLLTEACAQYPHIVARGSELSPMVYLWGRLRILLSGQKADLRMKDLFTEDLRDADCIFLYLMPAFMERLHEKFRKELRPGTKIVSYTFAFTGLDPVETKVVPWIRGTQNVFLYVWPESDTHNRQ